MTAGLLFLFALAPAGEAEAAMAELAARRIPRELLGAFVERFRETDERKITGFDAARRQAFVAALLRRPELAKPLLKAAHNRAFNDAIWDLLAGFGEAAGESTEVEVLLRQAIGPIERDLEATDRLVNFYARQRRWAEIIKLSHSLGQFEAYRDLVASEALAELGHGEEALDCLNSQRLADYAVRRRIAHILGILGRHRDALAHLDAMLLEFHRFEDVRGIRLLRADALRQLGRHRDMEAEYHAILEDDPDDPLALNNLGYNLAEQNRKLIEAEAYLRHAIKMDRARRRAEPFAERATYLDSLAWILFKQGRFQEARGMLEKSVALPDGIHDAIVWDHLGDARHASGDRKGAIDAWRKAGRLFEGDHRGKENGRAAATASKPFFAALHCKIP